jgi:hypothetical protein
MASTEVANQVNAQIRAVMRMENSFQIFIGLTKLSPGRLIKTYSLRLALSPLSVPNFVISLSPEKYYAICGHLFVIFVSEFDLI